MNLRVWHVQNPPRPGTRYPVSTPREGARLIERLVAADLQDNHIWANAFGLEVWEDNEWCEWYDEYGRDVQALADTISERTGGQP